MSRSPTPRKRDVGQGLFRLIPTWNQEFDEAEYARILLLLSMYLSEQEAKKPKERGRKTSNTATHKAKGGEDHEQP